MKKKVISILLASVLTLSMLAGCGNDSAPSGGSSGQSSAAGGEDSSADATDDKADAPKIEISIMSWHGEGGESKFYDGLKYVMDSYTEVHPNVTFKYVQQPLDGYMDLLDTQFISGGAADIIHMQPHMSRTFADKGALLPLDEYMMAESAYVPGTRWVDTFSGGEASFASSKADNTLGAIMFVPNDGSASLSMGQPFFYNKTLFQKAGITELPETFEEFIDALRKLKDYGVVPVAAESVDRHVSWSFGWIGDQFGEHYIDQYFDEQYNGSDKVNLKMDKTAIALANDWLKPDDQIMVDISEAVYEYAQFWQDGWAGASYNDAKNLFLMQEAAIFQEGFWAFTEYQDVIMEFEWGVLPIPLVKKDTSEYAMEGFMKASGNQDYGFDVNAKVAEDPDKLAAVIDFLQYLSSPDVQQEYVKIAISMSPIEGVEQPEEVQPFLFDTELCLYEQSFGANYVDYGDVGIWGGLTQEYLTGRIDTETFNKRALENSKQTAVNTCRDNLKNLPDSIAEAEARLQELKGGTNEAAIQAQEKTVELLKLKLQMYQQYFSE